ncbi:ROK family protein [Dactylosporangium aurantiacum]|uniref:ROK family protein n=1 Tax=Dactylosporangium aurantiacum TaxID=35754 RepID=A0A9Q9IK99_9ACTN|nr:ROK family protein [Dactylosporangium aurantiacum]MDG6105535.1 ROK family protein [Dactylosporangium aurantiacum]UWZ57121.1 ROK family protein [Dactylosporangium aurantiacum]
MSTSHQRSTPTQDSVRRQNLGALLRYVHVAGDTSRAELTNQLGLNRSTIGALTADLAGAGLIDEGTPQETGRAGRPSLVVRPRSSRVYGYALSIEVDRLRAARVGLGGKVLDSRELPRPHGTAVRDTVATLAGFVHDMQRATPPDGVFVGSGIAVSRMMRHADGVVRVLPAAVSAADGVAVAAGTSAAAAAGAAGIVADLGVALGAELGLDRPPVVGAVADLAALAEHTRGAAAGLDNVVHLHGDAGISAGIIADGRRVTGHGGHGGEVGHMVVNPQGRECGCGSRGCWEMEIARHVPLERDAVRACVDAARRGDPAARATLRQAADWLGFGVANLVNVFNPTAVVFGGALRELYLAGAAQVRGRLATMALPACREHLRLRTPLLGDDAPLVGAAELAFERLLADPLETADS